MKKLASLKNILNIPEYNILQLLRWLAIIVTFYSLFYAVTIDCYQEPYDWIKLPIKTLFKYKNPSTSFNQLVNSNQDAIFKKPNKNIQETTYIFILDISGSIIKMDGKHVKIKKPLWYKSDLKYLSDKNFIDEDIYNELKESEDEVLAYSATKVLLYHMLAELLDYGSSRRENDKFAVWSLGDHATRIFPDPNTSNIQSLNGKTYAEINRNFISEAIKKINSLKINNKNTDFKELFDEIWETYCSEKNNLMLIIFSDCIHDVKDKEEFKGQRNKREQYWDELKKQIQLITNANITANLVSISNNTYSDKKSDKNIFTVFDKNSQKFFLSKKAINEHFDRAFNYSKVYFDNFDNSIIFYYESSSYINSYFNIFFSENSNIELEIPQNLSKNLIDDISFKWSIIAADNVEKRQQGKISKYQLFKSNIKKNQSLRLFYSKVPLLRNIPIRLTDHKSRTI